MTPQAELTRGIPDVADPLYSDVLGCRGIRNLKTQQCDNGPFARRTLGFEDTGMIGFDIACESARSGPRMQGYLVNDLCKPISAETKRTEFALAA